MVVRGRVVLVYRTRIVVGVGVDLAVVGEDGIVAGERRREAVGGIWSRHAWVMTRYMRALTDEKKG